MGPWLEDLDRVDSACIGSGLGPFGKAWGWDQDIQGWPRVRVARESGLNSASLDEGGGDGIEARFAMAHTGSVCAHSMYQSMTLPCNPVLTMTPTHPDESVMFMECHDALQ